MSDNRVGSFCPEHGINCKIDDDGTCSACGASAVGTALDEIERLREDGRQIRAEANVVTWRFDIEKPEGERRLLECLKAPDVKCALSDFDNELRRRWKYGEDEAQMMTVEQVRGLLWATLNRWKVDLDDD